MYIKITNHPTNQTKKHTRHEHPPSINHTNTAILPPTSPRSVPNL